MSLLPERSGSPPLDASILRERKVIDDTSIRLARSLPPPATSSAPTTEVGDVAPSLPACVKPDDDDEDGDVRPLTPALTKPVVVDVDLLLRKRVPHVDGVVPVVPDVDVSDPTPRTLTTGRKRPNDDDDATESPPSESAIMARTLHMFGKPLKTHIHFTVTQAVESMAKSTGELQQSLESMVASKIAELEKQVGDNHQAVGLQFGLLSGSLQTYAGAQREAVEEFRQAGVQWHAKTADNVAGHVGTMVEGQHALRTRLDDTVTTWEELRSLVRSLPDNIRTVVTAALTTVPASSNSSSPPPPPPPPTASAEAIDVEVMDEQAARALARAVVDHLLQVLPALRDHFGVQKTTMFVNVMSKAASEAAVKAVNAALPSLVPPAPPAPTPAPAPPAIDVPKLIRDIAEAVETKFKSFSGPFTRDAAMRTVVPPQSFEDALKEFCKSKLFHEQVNAAVTIPDPTASIVALLKKLESSLKDHVTETIEKSVKPIAESQSRVEEQLKSKAGDDKVWVEKLLDEHVGTVVEGKFDKAITNLVPAIQKMIDQQAAKREELISESSESTSSLAERVAARQDALEARQDAQEARNAAQLKAVLHGIDLLTHKVDQVRVQVRSRPSSRPSSSSSSSRSGWAWTPLASGAPVTPGLPVAPASAPAPPVAPAPVVVSGIPTHVPPAGNGNGANGNGNGNGASGNGNGNGANGNGNGANGNGNGANGNGNGNGNGGNGNGNGANGNGANGNGANGNGNGNGGNGNGNGANGNGNGQDAASVLVDLLRQAVAQLTTPPVAPEGILVSDALLLIPDSLGRLKVDALLRKVQELQLAFAAHHLNPADQQARQLAKTSLEDFEKQVRSDLTTPGKVVSAEQQGRITELCAALHELVTLSPQRNGENDHRRFFRALRAIAVVIVANQHGRVAESDLKSYIAVAQRDADRKLAAEHDYLNTSAHLAAWVDRAKKEAIVQQETEICLTAEKAAKQTLADAVQKDAKSQAAKTAEKALKLAEQKTLKAQRDANAAQGAPLYVGRSGNGGAGQQ